MTGKTIVTNSGKMVMTGTMGGEALAVLYDLRWMLVCIVVLILADFWFGLSDSLHRKEEFRFSRAGRRTCNKFVDYMTYLLVGVLMGLGIFEPLGWADHVTTAAVGLGFGFVWEIDSIVGHVCALKGMENRYSVKRILVRFIVALVKKKSHDVGEALEESVKEKDQPL